MSSNPYQIDVQEIQTILRTTNFFEEEQSYETIRGLRALAQIVNRLRVPPFSLLDVDIVVRTILEVLDQEHAVYAARVFASTVFTLPPGKVRQTLNTALLRQDGFRFLLQESTTADADIARDMYVGVQSIEVIKAHMKTDVMMCLTWAA
jgi:hypothetical protein